MTCRVAAGVAVCGPPAGVYCRRYLDCGPCGKRHGFVTTWDGAWYGTTDYGSCGDRWQDGEMAPRPFRPGWRKAARAKFRDMWKHAAPRALWDSYVRADVAVALADDWQSAAQQRDAAHLAILDRRQP